MISLKILHYGDCLRYESITLAGTKLLTFFICKAVGNHFFEMKSKYLKTLYALAGGSGARL